MPPESPPESPSAAHPIQALGALRDLLRRRLAQDPAAVVWIPPMGLDSLNKLGCRVRSYRRGEAGEAARPVPARPSPEPLEPADQPTAATELARIESASERTAPDAAISGDKWMRLAAIRVRAERCPRCRGLGTLRDKMVFAAGSPNARILFVGEAPGAEEERRGEPFVGPTGALLDRIINAMGLQRSDVYISNIVKYRPMIDDGTRQGESNRKPTAEEMAASLEYVLGEIEVVDPEIVVALGGTAMEGLLGYQGSVSSQRGRIQDFRGRKALVTYHPSYLLRNPDPGEKRKVWEDMKLVLRHLGLPVPGK